MLASKSERHRNMTDFAMHAAARKNDLERVRQLIQAGVPVDSLDEEGQTPLHLAATFGRYEVAALLINSKCDINLKDRCGLTPVMLAAIAGRPLAKEIVGFLLHRGAQVNCVDEDDGRTLLHWASYCWPDIVALVLDNGEADINAVSRDLVTPLMCAARAGNAEVASLLIRAGADVNRSDVWNTTALHLAVERGHTRVVQVLLEKQGLYLSPQDVDGNTPLHVLGSEYIPRFETVDRDREAIKLLLGAGANTNVKNFRGETALGVSIRRCNLTHEEIGLFVQKGAFLETSDCELLSRDPFLKENVLKDVELCTQSVVNKFNCQSLPALNSIAYFNPYFARRLPNVDNFKLGAQHIDEVKNLVECEIERNTFCNVVEIRPIALSALCVLSLITCQSGKKRAASAGFGHSPLKKKHN